MKKHIASVGITMVVFAMLAFNVVPAVAATSPSVRAGGLDVASYMSTADVFPATTVLDNFDRADGPPGPSWASIDPAYPLPNIAGGRLVATGNASGYWVLKPPPNQEAFLHLTDPPVPDDYVLMLRLNGTLPTTSENGYCAYFNPTLGTVTIKRSDGGDKTVIGGPFPVSPGAWIGFRAVGTTLTAYTSYDGASWLTVGSATDTKYPDGHIGWFVNAFAAGAEFAIDDFGGTPGLPPPVNTAVPTIRGTDTLRVSNGSWNNSPTAYAYQWRRNGKDIPGATRPVYHISPADQGAKLTARVTARNANGSATVTTAGRRIAPAWVKDCATVHKRYPHGVGRVGAHDRTRGTPVTNFKRSTLLYRFVVGWHPGLDSDRDGIACEK